MSTRAGIVSRLRSFFRPADAEARMEEEFGFHIEMETRRLVAEGISAAEARRRARVSFGGADAHREAMRDGRGTQWIEDAAADLRYALRSMRRSPGLAIAVALTFGVGVGVNGIVFSFVNSILLRPLPAGQTEELVAMYSHDVSDGDADPIGYDDFLDYRRRSGAFADLAAFNGVPLNLVAGASGSGDMVWGDIVSENFFSVLRMRPAVGRFFTEADGPAGANPLVVLSHRAWRIRFRGDSNVVGQRIRLNGTEFTVVGVAPEGFHGLRTFGFWSDMWVPLGMHRVLVPGSRLEGRGSGWLLTVGRIRPGTSIEATRRSAMLFAKQLQAGYPESNANIEVLVVPAGRGFDNPTSVKPAVLLLVSATGIIAASLMLLLICANLANVQLARAAARGREIAVRLSLGCSRPRLTRQLVVESVTLALPGALIGAGLLWLAPMVEQGLLPRMQHAVGFDARPDWRVIAFTTALSLLAVMLFGLLPALRATRSDIAPSLSTVIGRHRRSGRLPERLRGSLVVSQLAISVVLLVAGTLFVRSLLVAQAADVGFDHDRRLLASVNLQLQGYDPARGRRFFDDVLARVRALPGVTAATWAGPIPFDGFGTGVPLWVEGMPLAPASPGFVPATFTAEDAVRALGLRLLAGRDFMVGDSAGARNVMMVSRALAARLWPGRDPVGQRARRGGSDGVELTVVGVVGDARYAMIGADPPGRVYLPQRQMPRGQATLVVHVTSMPERAVPQVRRIIAGIDPTLPVYGVRTMDDNVRSGFAVSKSAAWVFGSFSLIALLIASVGLYAVVASGVVERTREIGVRIALGATAWGVLVFVMRRSASLALAGLVIGLGLALVVSRGMASILMGLSANDPITYLVVPVVLAVVVAVATYLPARRAVKVDPAQSLRSS